MARAYVIILDTIYECDGRIIDENFIVSSGPPEYSLSGNIFSKGKWALIKDTAFLYLERTLKLYLKEWQEHAERYEKAKDAYGLQQANSQVDAYKQLLPRARLMDETMLKRKK